MQRSCFIRTDPLDGETDWKLRLAVQNTQNLHSNVVGVYLHFDIVGFSLN